MENIYHYVYCQGVLGVKSNVRDFKWVYGSDAPVVSSEEYEKCVVKVDVCIRHEKHLNENRNCDKKFQAYEWDNRKRMLSYRRKFPFNLTVGYDIKILKNTIYAEVGECYYKFIKNRVMNLHGIYYLLSDLANMLLLKNGFLTLYASAVRSKKICKCAVNFAPPNTGKTFTAIKLCESNMCELVSEDVAITDGSIAYSCPWTSSYRSNNAKVFDSAGALVRTKKCKKMEYCEKCEITDITILTIGEKKIDNNKEYVRKRLPILNGYLFNYYSSPIIKVMGFFDENYNLPWDKYANNFLSNIVNNCNCHIIQAKESRDFAGIIEEFLFGEKNENFSNNEKCMG